MVSVPVPGMHPARVKHHSLGANLSRKVHGHKCRALHDISVGVIHQIDGDGRVHRIVQIVALHDLGQCRDAVGQQLAGHNRVQTNCGDLCPCAADGNHMGEAAVKAGQVALGHTGIKAG